MITILFDIDGTLLRSGGAGLTAIGQAMEQMFGLASIAGVDVHGRTDNGILGDIFEHHSLSFEEHRDQFNEEYWSRLPKTLAHCEGSILPGAAPLLGELQRYDQVALGLLTGNSNRAAEIKLRHFGLHHFFEFGGYGDLHSDRNDVAALARQSAEQYLGSDFDSNHLWVVGDTVNDIACARSIGSRVVAVETGGCDPGRLNDANPDLQLSSLSDTATFLRVVVGEMAKKVS